MGNTQTDHNLVVMNMKIEFSKLNKPKKSPNPRINEENFTKPELAKKYKEEIIKRQNSAERKVCTTAFEAPPTKMLRLRTKFIYEWFRIME